MTEQTTASNTPPKDFLTHSRGFVDWLANREVSIAFTTYQSGKLFFLGRNQQGRLSGFERTFKRAMGLVGDAQTIYLATVFQIWRLENVLDKNAVLEGYDRSYIPQTGYTTGDLDVHDVALDGQGEVRFISARFNCLATLSDRYHFAPLWMPRFITKLASEDRCHLNGLAMREGKPRYVTACSQTDIYNGWREHRHNGGCVIDIESDEVLAEGFSMPHSPRWYRDRLWLLDSGNGAFGYLDLESGKFEQVCFCPGFARGLSFIGDFAVVGLSLPRHDSTFSGLPLEQKLEAAKVSARCGLVIIDLRSGDVVQWLDIGEPVRELYDVLVLPGAKRPRLVGFQTDEIRTHVWGDPQAAQRLSRS